MKNEKKNNGKKSDGFIPSIIMICVLSVVAFVCCGYLALSHLKPEVADNVKDAFTFLYDENAANTTGDDGQNKSKGETSTARLMFAGENLIYETMYNEAKEKAEDGYDFSYIYEDIKDIIKESDIAMINNATVISGNISPSTYPKFCSPTQLGDALCDIGFNVINQASKNIWDKGEDGAKDTIDYWKTKSDVLLTGLYEDETDMASVKVKEANGIKFAFISFTYELKASGYSSESGVQIITLDETGKTQVDAYNQIKHMIKDAKDVADVVVVAANFSGDETKEPTSSQQTCINYLVSFGADVVIGTGTHSVQPLEVRDNGDGTTAVIANSLGNFMSAQTDKENMLGAIADIVYSKDSESGEVKLESAKLIPTVTMAESGKKNYHVLPFSQFTQELAQEHAMSGFTYEFASEYFEEVIEDRFLEKTVMDTEDLIGNIDLTAQDTTEDNEDISDTSDTNE